MSNSQDKEEQRRVVWARLLNHHSNLASRLSKQKERYLALCQELNPRTTQVKSSHNPLYCDTKPLNELTHKDVPFVWEDKHKVAFNALQDLVTSEPVLQQPQLDKPFKVEVDTLGFALGGVLLQ